MANMAEKFFKSLKLREVAEMESRMGMKISDLGDASEAVVAAVLLLTAKKRLGAGFKYEDAEELTFEEANDQLVEALTRLGFENDPEDADADFTDTEA